MEKQDKSLIFKLIKKSKFGLTITELTMLSNFSRSKVRTLLSNLEGAERIQFKPIGMAKVYGVKK
ncbi:hypothetical protein KAR91_03355 [Candidatus Pacearchaeota archaeon]|nr:hypothetical protein [Candidatus Pacearchaeota archaeon]